MTEHTADRILDACGITQPLILEVQDLLRNESYGRTCAVPFTVIGRDARTDLTIDDSEVSGRHAYLQIIEGQAFCIDLGSRAGVLLGGSPCPSGWVAPGQPIQIGQFVITVSSGCLRRKAGAGAVGDRPNPLVARSLEFIPLPSGVLKFGNAVQSHKEARLNRVLTLLGSAPACKFQLPPGTVSRFHCSLLRTPLGIWVIDLLGRGGIFVNGLQVRSARLEHGDLLEVGKLEIIFNYEYPVIARQRTAVAPKTELALGTQAEPVIAGPLVPVSGQEGALASLLSSISDLQPVTGPASFAPDLIAGNFANGDEARNALALVAPLVEQLSVMQQQMFDQFQHVILAMFRMFGTMHQDQSELVQGELERIREVSRELQALQVRPAGPEPESRDDSLDVPEPAQGTRAAAHRSDPLDASDLGIGAIDQALASLGLRNLGSPGREERPKPVASGGDGAASLPDRQAETAPKSPETQIHAFINQRIMALQQERLSRWQKILSVIGAGQR